MTKILRGTLALCMVSFLIMSNRAYADDAAQTKRTAVLHFINGDHVTGTLVSSNQEDCLGWQSPQFVSPFQFSMSGLASIHFSAPAALPQTDAMYGFQLATGDLLFGSLVALSEKSAVVEVPELGRVTVDRSIIQRIFRRGGGNDVLFVGPSGLVDWETPDLGGLWLEDAGHLTSDKPGAILRRNFHMPNQVRIEFELSWTTHPDFELAIAVDSNPKTISRSYRFDIWENELVIQRETEREANVESLQKVGGKPGRIHVQAFLDQLKGRMLVYSSVGEPLADLTVTTAKPEVFGGIQLTNRRGDIRLERLQISRWNGEMPRTVEADKSRIHDSDGAIIYGTLKSYDADKREFLIANEANSQTISESRVQDVFFAEPANVTPRSIRAIFLTGMKISGELIRTEEKSVTLKSPDIEEPILIPLEALQSLVMLRPKTEPPESPQRRGRLVTTGTTIHGCMVDGTKGDSSCLVWQPIHSTTPSALKLDTSARVIYQDPPKKPVHIPFQQNQRGREGAIPQRIVKKAAGKKPQENVEFVLHLRTGDKVPCSEMSIDEQGLSFKSSISNATLIPHDKIHAVELLPNEEPVTIDPKKRERLLTLPRMQRGNPPTHLLRSVDGDYLRGRLVSMNDAQVQVELHLEGKIIRRDRIVRMIWLHPESMNSTTDKPENRGVSSMANLVQAVYHPDNSIGSVPATEGNRLTFAPDHVEGTFLCGTSEIFGVCRVDLMKVDQLYIGAAIETATADLPFASWKLKNSLDPLAPPESNGESDDGSEGKDAALVGKMAPEISLKTLDNKDFRLSEHKDKIVILDFWASWCGPCLQVMPQIDKIAEEFADLGVELYAINLEESPEKIRMALERLKLSPHVLLDQNGRIAEKYGASSIPQTVIINRDGTIARLFVGGGSRFDERLRAALKSVISGEPSKKE